MYYILVSLISIVNILLNIYLELGYCLIKDMILFLIKFLKRIFLCK
jgi:hypothetical protein